MKCQHCGDCCNHVALEIDKPTCKRDFQNILWYLLHKGVRVWSNDDGEWFVEFSAQCEWRSGGGCVNHSKRPQICREYNPEECVRNNGGNGEKHSFESYGEFIKFLESRKYDYEFKQQKEERKQGKTL